MKTQFDFKYQLSHFTCSRGRSIDADLDRKETIPTIVFLSEVTEISTGVIGNSGTNKKGYRKEYRKTISFCSSR